MTTTTKQEKYRTRFKQLYASTSNWRSHWKDICDYLLPEKGRYLTGDEDKRNEGKKKHQKIINGSAKDSVRVLSAGMQGGMTSPSRPWFVLKLGNEELMEIGAVRYWLHTVRNIMLDVLHGSNFYDSMHGCYTEIAGFGTTAMLIEEDFETIVRFRLFTIGEYMLGLDSRYRANALYRQFSLTARQVISEFGREQCSISVQTAYDNNQGETLFEIIHCIQPKNDVDSTQAGVAGMSYESVYFELKENNDKFLRESGYDGKPFVAGRWDFAGVDVYGSCPAMDALGDIKMLQKLEEKKIKKIDKHVDPAMNAPTAMKGQGGSIIPGAVNYVDNQQGMQGFVPTYQIDANLQSISVEIERVEKRIQKTFYNHLFLSLLDTTKRMTATETAMREEETMLILGPVLERLQNEIHSPAISRVFDICMRFDIFPPAPRELEGIEINIEYISTLAQAQRMVGTPVILRTAEFVGNLAAIKPNILDKFDADEALDQFAAMNGTPPKIIVSDDTVAEIRKQRAAQEQRNQQIQQALAAAEGAKTLSDTEPTDANLLGTLTQGVGAG